MTAILEKPRAPLRFAIPLRLVAQNKTYQVVQYLGTFEKYDELSPPSWRLREYILFQTDSFLMARLRCNFHRWASVQNQHEETVHLSAHLRWLNWKEDLFLRLRRWWSRA
jgi:hypothetical protein